MVLGEQLSRLRRELAYLDHDLVVDGKLFLIYCARCHENTVITHHAQTPELLLGLARRHWVDTHSRDRVLDKEVTNDEPWSP